MAAKIIMMHYQVLCWTLGGGRNNANYKGLFVRSEPSRLAGLVCFTGLARLRPHFLIKLLLCLYEKPRPRAPLLEPRSRQAGQPTFSWKHKVHKQVCLKIKIRLEIEVEFQKARPMFLVWQGCFGEITQKHWLWFAHILNKGFNFFLIIQRHVSISEQLHWFWQRETVGSLSRQARSEHLGILKARFLCLTKGWSG